MVFAPPRMALGTGILSSRHRHQSATFRTVARHTSRGSRSADSFSTVTLRAWRWRYHHLARFVVAGTLSSSAYIPVTNHLNALHLQPGVATSFKP